MQKETPFRRPTNWNISKKRFTSVPRTDSLTELDPQFIDKSNVPIVYTSLTNRPRIHFNRNKSIVDNCVWSLGIVFGCRLNWLFTGFRATGHLIRSFIYSLTSNKITFLIQRISFIVSTCGITKNRQNLNNIMGNSTCDITAIVFLAPIKYNFRLTYDL